MSRPKHEVNLWIVPFKVSCCAATHMGTLNGTVSAEIDTATSVRGVADVVERHIGCGKIFALTTLISRLRGEDSDLCEWRIHKRMNEIKDVRASCGTNVCATKIRDHSE
jgi:hypothetical protein